METENNVESGPAHDHFICPISLEMMTDPVICSDGITYERASICHWFETHNTSPKTNARLSDKSLIPNLALKAGITRYQAEQEEKAAGAKRKLEDAESDPVEIIRKGPARKAKKSRARATPAADPLETLSVPPSSSPTLENGSSAEEALTASPTLPSQAPVAGVTNDETIQIFVKTISNATISVKVNKTGSIADIKSAISAQEGIKLDEMRLIYKGKQLESHFLLADYKVANHDVMHIVLRLKGGGGYGL